MGLWNQPVTLNSNSWEDDSHFRDHYAIALVVFTLLPLLALIWIWLNSERPSYNGNDGSLRAAAFSRLGTSTVFLIIFYFLRNLDIFLSEFQVRALYGYYFIYAFTDPFFGVFADLMILFVTLRMFRYIFPAQRKRNRLSGIVQLGVEGLAIPLLALALFQWALSIANLVVFLNETSAVASDALSLEYSKLSAGFSLLYLIMSGILWGNSLLLASSRWVAGMPSEESSFLAVTTIITARSMLMAVTQIKYSLQGQTRPHYEATVETAIYGTLSIALYYLVTKLSAVQSSSSVEFDILRDGLQNARKDLTRRRYDASHGGPAYPSSSAELLGELRASPLKYFSKKSISSMSTWDNAAVDSLIEKHTKKVLKMR